MGNTDQRRKRRFKVAIRAVITDSKQRNALPCMIQDGSIFGCKIISRQACDLPDKVLLDVPQLSQLLKGCVINRNQHSAEIEFQWETKSSDERRNAARQEVAIQATIMDYNLNKLADCVICDASKTGCRISSEELSTLPDDFHIEIPGLTEPIMALVVWRKDNMAGLEFFWESEVYTLDDTLTI